MYDVIVVGARCAGSPAAMLLARRGYRVLAVDRARFPSDTPSTHFLHTPAVARLQRWGLLDRVLATGCPPITRIVWGMNDTLLEGPPPAHDGIDYAIGPRRTVLDKILVDAAREAGAEVREGFTVREVLSENGRVHGIRGTDAHGVEHVETARFVIGADGLGSIVARTVRPEEIAGAPAKTAVWYSYWHDTPIDYEIFVRVDGREVFIIPTNDGNVNVMVGWRRHEYEQFRADVEGNYHRTLDLFPEVAALVRGGERVEPFYAFKDTQQWLRVPHGPGWALLGDAAHLKDPVAGIGITDSFRTAEAMVQALDDWFSGRAGEQEAFAGYREWRDETFSEAFGQHLRAARLEPYSQDLLTVIEAAKLTEEHRVAFFGLLGALTPLREYFRPENVTRILADAEAVTGRPWRLRDDVTRILGAPAEQAAAALATGGPMRTTPDEAVPAAGGRL
ncbi:MAG TPA: NAD(P)/FAD-dependent oxidoreductase [Actinospica sp.]|jgi:flavin-dependent dehydrogenase|nr:NAD(P)/FAD-dependent oxidoreductase [Actinospica sp.]